MRGAENSEVLPAWVAVYGYWLVYGRQLRVRLYGVRPVAGDRDLDEVRSPGVGGDVGLLKMPSAHSPLLSEMGRSAEQTPSPVSSYERSVLPDLGRAHPPKWASFGTFWPTSENTPQAKFGQSSFQAVR